MINFKNKVVLVTGVSSGIGKDCVKRFLEDGATVVGTLRKNAAMFDSLKKEYPGKLHIMYLDVTNRTQVQAVLEETIEKMGHIDVLVNNAGVHANNILTETPEEQWDLLFNANVKSIYHMCYYAIPYMQKQKDGVVINIASRVGTVGSPKSAAYCASKAAVINLTREMALDYASDHIRINAVSPGMVETPMVDRQFDGDLLRKKATIEMYPLKRFAISEDVVNVVEFLASDGAAYLTGINIPVDGGRSAI